jgi:pimeloyl-ACP methyl ester carboxylesterase
MPTVLLATALTLAAADASQAKLDPTALGSGFQRYTTTDSLGRTITFYLSSPGEQAAARLPVALLVQGSGCQSLFRKRDERVYGGQQNLLLEAAKGRVRVLAVEKPGVNYLDEAKRPGAAEGAAEEFLKEHTLPRWTAANRAALLAAWTLSDIDRSRTLLVGHSEGGIVVARLAAEMPEITHVASLAGGGPTQLFSLAESRAVPRANDQPGDAARRVQALYDEWSAIQKDPESTTRFWMGHPYRRWSSFLQTTVRDELLGTKARIFLAQGGRDNSVPPAGHDVLVAELRAKARDVTAERIDDADHGFSKPDQGAGSGAGMRELLGRVVDWFLAAP